MAVGEGPDRDRLRDLVVDTNDGIIAVAGVVEGVLGAGLGRTAVLTAVLTATVAGGLSLASSKFTEVAFERDARDEVLEEERRQLDRSPAEELAELVSFYEAKGLTPALAREVATRLTEIDALAAHAEEEHGLAVVDRAPSPLVAALASGAAFALGAMVVVLSVVLTPSSSWAPTTFVAVGLSLTISSLVVARWGEVPLGRTLVRTVGIGLAAMAITFAIGSLVEG
jgi:VIT1/CCC1 family predicted Fe2+/Mn2+ transporter